MLRLTFLLLCLLAAGVPLMSAPNETSVPAFPGWPGEWDGRSLVELPLSEREMNWSRNFPGKVAKFSDGERELLIRWINRGSRQLHSSTDCFRAVGYSVSPAPALRDVQGRRWSCFNARRQEKRLLLRERIADDRGGEWTDVSAWFWSVLGRKTGGPWWAVTLVETAPE